MKSSNVGASVRQRLLNLAQAKGWVFNRILMRQQLLCSAWLWPNCGG